MRCPSLPSSVFAVSQTQFAIMSIWCDGLSTGADTDGLSAAADTDGLSAAADIDGGR